MTKTTSTPVLPNLVGARRAELAQLLAGLDPRPFRAEQVYQWLARRMAGSIAEMTNLPKALREALAGHYRLIAAKSPAQARFLNGWLARAYS